MEIFYACRKLNSSLINDFIKLTRGSDFKFDSNDISYFKACLNSNNSIKFTEKLTSIFNKYLKQSHYNVKITNLPKFAPLSENGALEPVQNIHIRDTMKQFGRVNDVFISNNTAYVSFKDIKSAEKACNLFNQQQLHTNIIGVKCV